MYRIVLIFGLLSLTHCGFSTEHGDTDSYASLATGGQCDAQLKMAYARTYHPFLSSRCTSCHATAHGSPDVNISFAAFMERGTNLIDYQSTHAHGGNSLNPAETQPMIDSIKPTFVAAQNAYLECVAKNSGSLPGTKYQVADKTVPNLMSTASNNNWVGVEWDMENESAFASGNGLFKAFFRIEARVHSVNGVVQGINFRNPSLRLKAGSENIEIKTISIQVNGDAQNLVTTYSGVNAIVNQTTNTLLVANSSSALAYYPSVNATTRVGFLFEHVKNTTLAPTTPGGGPVVPIIPVPIPDVPIPTGGAKFSQLISDNSPYRVLARSCVGCHNANNMSGALNLADFAAASAKSAEIITRMNSTTNPMPPSGILRQNDRDMVQSWVDNGLPQ